jgi:hypothetical protein
VTSSGCADCGIKATETLFSDEKECGSPKKNEFIGERKTGKVRSDLQGHGKGAGGLFRGSG